MQLGTNKKTKVTGVVKLGIAKYSNVKNRPFFHQI